MSRLRPARRSTTSASARTTSFSPPSGIQAALPRSAAARKVQGSSCYLTGSRSSSPATSTSAEPALPGFLEVAARPGADDRLLRLAVLEQDHGRDREHAVPRRVARVVVDVHLRELDALVLLGERFEHRVDGPAGTAPRRPEVDDHGLVRLQDLSFERVVGDVLHRAKPTVAP